MVQAGNLCALTFYCTVTGLVVCHKTDLQLLSDRCHLNQSKSYGVSKPSPTCWASSPWSPPSPTPMETAGFQVGIPHCCRARSVPFPAMWMGHCQWDTSNHHQCSPRWQDHELLDLKSATFLAAEMTYRLVWTLLISPERPDSKDVISSSSELGGFK